MTFTEKATQKAYFPEMMRAAQNDAKSKKSDTKKSDTSKPKQKKDSKVECPHGHKH